MRMRPSPAGCRRGAVILLAMLAAPAIAGAGGEGEELPKAIIAGTIVDEAGKPVPGAEVSSDPRAGGKSARSGADGAFRLPIPLYQGEHAFAMLTVRDGDGRLGAKLVYGKEGEIEPARIVLKPARALDVRVIDDKGRPVEGAEVHFLADLQGIAHGRTDGNGRWVTKVPADTKRWGVYALKPKVGFDYVLAERARNSAEPPHPLPDQLALKLDGARPPLRIKAVGPAGEPLAGIEVGPWLIQKPGREADMNGMLDAAVQTDREGIATLEWLPARMEGQISIISRSPGYYPPEHATWIPADEPAGEVTIPFLPLVRLSGKVTNGDGSPAAGARVSLVGQGGSDNSFRGGARADAEGRYSLEVHSEQEYLAVASSGEQVSPCLSGVIARAGKPVEGVDLVLGRGTHLRGRVVVGKDEKPVAKTYVEAVLDKGAIPAELKKKEDRYYRGLSLRRSAVTDEQGRYDILLGPGEYSIQGPPRIGQVKLSIPADDPPAEIVRNFAMPRPEVGPLAISVIDEAGKPVPGAIVRGTYAAMEARRSFEKTTADAEGKLRVERSLDPLVLHAESLDWSLAGIARIDAESAEAKVVVKPAATATGRLVDAQGAPIVGRKVNYGIRVYLGPPKSSPFGEYFGGPISTNDRGEFNLPGLVVGESYEVSTPAEDQSRYFNAKEPIAPKAAGALALGDVTIDLNPPGSTPPTPAERTASSFEARKEKSPREKVAYVLEEAKREYTRPLLLLGAPNDPACVDLFRLLSEEPDDDEGKEGGRPRPKSPAELRWEFELASLDISRADAKELAAGLGVAPEGDSPVPTLAVLSDDGKLAESYPLRLGADKKLDAGPLGAFLLRHKPPTRDAEAMLAEALAKAKAEDKRVFLIMSASWCGPCRLLARFLAEHKAELGKHYAFVKLDISRDDHAEDLRLRYEGKDSSNGVPWYAILDADGKALITSNAPQPEDYGSTNIGFPSSKEGIAHFAKMLADTAPRLPAEALGRIRLALEKKP